MEAVDPSEPASAASTALGSVGHLADTGQGDVRLGDPARTVREDDRRDPDRGVPRRGLLERRVGRGGIVTPAGNADLGQDLARLEPGR